MRGVDGGVRSDWHLQTDLPPKARGVLLERVGSVVDLLRSFDSLRLHAVKL